jgi:hypothetical protein
MIWVAMEQKSKFEARIRLKEFIQTKRKIMRNLVKLRKNYLMSILWVRDIKINFNLSLLVVDLHQIPMNIKMHNSFQ